MTLVKLLENLTSLWLQAKGRGEGNGKQKMPDVVKRRVSHSGYD